MTLTCAASVGTCTACVHRPQEAGATLRFGLTFGASPRVVFTFLRSYEQLGSVTVGFAAAAGDEAGKQQSRNKVAGAVYEIDGIWPEGTMPPGDGGRVSQVHSLALNVQQAEVQQRHDGRLWGAAVQPSIVAGQAQSAGKVQDPQRRLVLSVKLQCARSGLRTSHNGSY
jgi:hypothetical protein